MIVLLGHGSPDPRSAAGLRSLARAVARRRPDTTVEVAFLDHAEPSLTALAIDLAAEGHRDAVVVPVFLTSAFHVRSDVPRVVAHAESASGLRLVVTAPLGPDSTLIDIMSARLPNVGPVVLACAGTRDVDAQGELEHLAREWSRRRGENVVVAYASMAQPDVAQALSELAPAPHPPVIASYVLFPGVLPDRIRAAGHGLVVSPPLGDAVADLVVARVDALRTTCSVASQ